MLYLPENPLAQRMYDWLLACDRKEQFVVYPREKLLELAIATGHSKEAGWAALKNLESVCNVCSYWASDERTVFFSVADLSPKEKLKQIEDDLWFESLPG